MKKVSLLSFFLFLLVANVVTAQTKEDMQASNDRVEKLRKLTEKTPEKTGCAEVDAYTTAVFTAATASLVSSEQLEDLYYRSVGESKDGVADVTIKKPTLEECTLLATSLTVEAVSIKKAQELAEAATKGVKGEKNRLKAAKLAKSMNLTVEVANIITQESVAKTKAVSEIISTVKSADNL